MDDCGEGPGTELCHLVVNTQEVPAQSEHVYLLHSERVEGDFPKDWLLTAYGGVQGSRPLTVNITLDNETRHQWTWAANAFSSNSSRIDETGHYEMRIVNPWDQPVRYQFYFDQSCSCTFKVIPI